MKVIVFGAGKGARNTIELIKMSNKLELLCILDNNKDIWGTSLHGFSIFSPSEIHKFNYDIILIASQYHKQITPQLFELGVKPEKIQLAHRNMMLGISLDYNMFSLFDRDEAPDYRPFFNFREEVLLTIAKHVELVIATRIKGSIAEFGCGTGQSSYMLARTLRDCSQYYNMPAKHLHLFDSFEGLPASIHDIDLESPLVQSNVWGEGACADISAKQLADTLNTQLEFSDFSIYQGWFEETLMQIKPEERFALIHLDCDLYESTYQVLDYMFSHELLSKGAILLFDDWSCNGNLSEFGQQRAWADICDKYDIQFEPRGHYGIGSCILAISDYSKKSVSNA